MVVSMRTPVEILSLAVNDLADALRYIETLEGSLRATRRDRGAALRLARGEHEARLALVAATQARADRSRRMTEPECDEDCPICHPLEPAA